jgi:hypothetical protein
LKERQQERRLSNSRNVIVCIEISETAIPMVEELRPPCGSLEIGC